MTIAPNDFTHLHVHSEFSLLDGLGRITELVDAAAAAGHATRWPSPTTARSTARSRSTRRPRNKGIKPIIGVETYVARRSMTDKEGKADAQPFHLILLAKDLVGYRNLCRLVTDAHLDGYYYKPRIDREHLARYSEGLIGLSACLGGEVPQGARGRRLGARPQRSPASTATSSARTASSSSSRTTACPSSAGSTSSCCGSRPEAGLPLVVTNDLHYVREDQSEAHDVLLCVGTGNNLDTPEPDEVRDARLLPEVGGRDGGAVPGPARGDPQHAPDRRDDRPRRCRSASCGSRTSRCPTARPSRPGCARSASAASSAATATVTPELQQRLDYELGVIIVDGLRRLLPDRRRLHPRSPASRGSRRPAGAARRARS